MTRREDVAALCREGLSPSAIGERLGLTMYVVKTHLLTQVGEGAIRRSDILFSIAAEQRRQFEEFIKANQGNPYWKIINAAAAAVHEKETFRLFLDLAQERVWRGDLYEYIADIELALHDRVKRALAARFGDGEAGWWRQGVPPLVRTACVTARENDPSPADHPFAYTTFIHLGEIIEKKWDLLVSALPKLLAQSRKTFSTDLRRLNGIRNSVMHPCKRIEPTEDDFLFVRSFWRAMSCTGQGSGSV